MHTYCDASVKYDQEQKKKADRSLYKKNIFTSRALEGLINGKIGRGWEEVSHDRWACVKRDLYGT